METINIIAIVTSTSFINKENWPSSYLADSDLRVKQTVKTIESLKSAGIREIYLFDNSGIEYKSLLEAQYKNVNLILTNQYAFQNKGISEAHLILNNLKCLPDSTWICKISARYELTDKNIFWSNAVQLSKHELVALKGNRGISTRMYFVQSKKIIEKLLVASINRAYHRHYAITGPKSFLNYVKRFYKNDYQSTPFLSIEGAIFEILPMLKINVKYIEKLGLRGTLGLDSKTLIEE